MDIVSKKMSKLWLKDWQDKTLDFAGREMYGATTPHYLINMDALSDEPCRMYKWDGLPVGDMITTKPRGYVPDSPHACQWGWPEVWTKKRKKDCMSKRYISKHWRPRITERRITVNQLRAALGLTGASIVNRFSQKGAMQFTKEQFDTIKAIIKGFEKVNGYGVPLTTKYRFHDHVDYALNSKGATK